METFLQNNFLALSNAKPSVLLPLHPIITTFISCISVNKTRKRIPFFFIFNIIFLRLVEIEKKIEQYNFHFRWPTGYIKGGMVYKNGRAGQDWMGGIFWKKNRGSRVKNYLFSKRINTDIYHM